jgi:hypothetical protein
MKFKNFFLSEYTFNCFAVSVLSFVLLLLKKGRKQKRIIQMQKCSQMLKRAFCEIISS